MVYLTLQCYRVAQSEAGGEPGKLPNTLNGFCVLTCTSVVLSTNLDGQILSYYRTQGCGQLAGSIVRQNH
jgi:hypothetical protein